MDMNRSIREFPELHSFAPKAVGMISSYRLAQVVFVISVLGIPDLLVSGPKSVEELAQLSKSHAGTLFRVLRAAAAVGIFRCEVDGRFVNTVLSESLRMDADPPLRSYAVMLGEDWHWKVWKEILPTVVTGIPAFTRIFGCGMRDFLADNAPARELYYRAMDGILGLGWDKVLSMCSLEGEERILYLGYAGGYVRFFEKLLRQYPDLTIILAEYPENAAPAIARLAHAGLADKCEVIEMEPSNPLPGGADVHFLRNVVSRIGDEEIKLLLRNSYNAIERNGRIVLVEAFIPPSNKMGLANLIDLEAMLVSADAKQRQESVYKEYLAEAGFSVTRVIEDGSTIGLIEAKKIG
jgi:hypothetical protein